MNRLAGGTVVVLLSVLVGSQAVAGSRAVVVKEQLNQTYGRELIAVPFSAPAGECAVGSLQLQGPDGAAPVQVSDVTFHSAEKKYLKSATVSFVVEKLAPLSTATYTLSWGTRKVASPKTDLSVRTKEKMAELGTGAVAVRLPMGSGDKGTAPPPLLGMRLGAGEWSAASEWPAGIEVTTWSAELLAGGPVFARTKSVYTLAGGVRVAFTATVVAGDSAVRWEMAVEGDRPDAAVNLVLPAVPGVKQASLPKGYGQWAKEGRQAAPSDAPEGFVALSPNSSLINIFADRPHRVVFKGETQTLELLAREPGAWVEPGELQTHGTASIKRWHLTMIEPMWEGWRRKGMPVRYREDGTVVLAASLASGRRVWSTSAGPVRVGDTLQRVRGMVLEWPSRSKHPRLFMGMKEIEGVWERAAGDPELAKALNGRWASAALAVLRKPTADRPPKEVATVVNRLRDQLGKMGNYDVMRGAIATVSLYDAIIDSDLLTAEDRTLFRAQMAYHAYLLADPTCWSIERGYATGNPNMHLSYTLSLGTIGCALRDHPQAKAWTGYATAWTDAWLDREVGENGEWLPEGSHYGMVSLEPLLTYAIAAKRAGIRDFTTDARLKKMTLYFAKMHTPRDPQRGNHRVTGAWGRGTSGDRLAVAGIAARMTADTDPDYAKTMQWLWQEGGYPWHVGDYRLGGYEPYYVDRTLPAAAPAWQSELFPELGTLLRADFNTPRESYLNLLAGVDSERNLDVWTPGVGTISQWFALGRPLSTCFTFQTGYKERHELLAEGVRLARNYEKGGQLDPFGHYTKTHLDSFASMASADYVRTRVVNTRVDERGWKPTDVPSFPKVKEAHGQALDVTRQLFFLRASSGAYVVLRDTTTGGEPTAWTFWTLSETIGTPVQVGDVAAALKDKDGKTITDARELPAGDRYTALGQFGVDVEYFIASPARTPRHTLRYGGSYRNVPEYQDALLLQQPGDGSYYVAILPRERAADAPAFSCLAKDKVIEIAHADATDYVFLAASADKAEAKGIAFEGTAGAIRQGKASTHLMLGAAGTVTAGKTSLAAPFAVELAVTGEASTLIVPDSCPGGEVTVTLGGEPRSVQLKAGAANVPLK